MPRLCATGVTLLDGIRTRQKKPPLHSARSGSVWELQNLIPEKGGPKAAQIEYLLDLLSATEALALALRLQKIVPFIVHDSNHEFLANRGATITTIHLCGNRHLANGSPAVIILGSDPE